MLTPGCFTDSFPYSQELVVCVASYPLLNSVSTWVPIKYRHFDNLPKAALAPCLPICFPLKSRKVFLFQFYLCSQLYPSQTLWELFWSIISSFLYCQSPFCWLILLSGGKKRIINKTQNTPKSTLTQARLLPQLRVILQLRVNQHEEHEGAGGWGQWSG